MNMYMYVCIQAEIEAFLDKVCDLFPVGKSEVSLCTLGAMRTSPGMRCSDVQCSYAMVAFSDEVHLL